jgi:hypothetical protein
MSLRDMGVCTARRGLDSRPGSMFPQYVLSEGRLRGLLMIIGPGIQKSDENYLFVSVSIMKDVIQSHVFDYREPV